MAYRGARRAATSRSTWLVASLGILSFASVAIVAVVVLTGGIVHEPAQARTPAVTGSAPAAKAGGTSVPAKAGLQTGSVTPEAPRSAELPSGKVVPIRPVDTTRNGTLDVPGDITISGWWRGGARLGDPFGSTLLSAHVDSSSQGLGPYAELLSVTAGETVVVTSDNLRQVFKVTSLELIEKGTLAAHPAIFSPSGERRLTLVTCAGPYLKNEGGYQRLAVVTASAVGEPAQRGE